MKRILTLLLLMLLIDLAGASVFFKIVDVPTVYVAPGEEAALTVFVQNLGSESIHASLKFRNLPEGISIVSPKCTKWVDSGTMREFDCLIMALADDIPQGRYTFEVGIAAPGAPPGWHEVEVMVTESLPEETPISTVPEYPACPVYRDPKSIPEEDTTTPGFGAALGGAALLLLAIRLKRDRE